MAAQSVAPRTVRAGDGARGLRRVLARPTLPPHTGIFKLHLQANETLNTSCVYDSIKLPPGIKEDDWIAAQVLGLYEQVQQTVSLLNDICDTETDICKCMNAGRAVQYAWADDQNPQPQLLSAPEYMMKLVEYAHGVLSNTDIVPTDGRPMPRKFRGHMAQLLKRFFRVYAHAYICHFKEISEECGVEAHLNCCFKRFLFFVLEFNLVKREDMAPLQDLIAKFEIDASRKSRDAASGAAYMLPQLLSGTGGTPGCSEGKSGGSEGKSSRGGAVVEATACEKDHCAGCA